MTEKDKSTVLLEYSLKKLKLPTMLREYAALATVRKGLKEARSPKPIGAKDLRTQSAYKTLFEPQLFFLLLLTFPFQYTPAIRL